MMEQLPQESESGQVERLEPEIEALLDKLQDYEWMWAQLPPDQVQAIEKLWWWVDNEIRVGKNREAARENLEDFIMFLQKFEMEDS